MQKINWSLLGCRHSFFLSFAIIIYAGFSSPTPDHIGWAEILSGSLLLLAATKNLPQRLFQLTAFEKWAGVCFLWLLFIPSLTGIISGQSPALIFRDLIALAFLFAPLFFLPVLQSPHRILPVILVLGGSLFAARYLLLSGLAFTDIGSGTAHDNLLYLPNSPLVIYSIIFSIGLLLLSQKTSIMIGLCLGIVAVVGFAALAGTLQRASLILCILASAVFIFLSFKSHPKRASIVCVVMTICLFAIPFLRESLVGIYDMAAHKTSLHGLNMRSEEFAAVLRHIGGSATAVLFGHGWGAMVQSPAVGGLWVNYTHNILSAFLLKTGLSGIMALILYLSLFIKPLIGLVRTMPIIATAVTIPLALGLTFYTSYKTLGFGLLLCLIWNCTFALAQAAKSRHK